MGPSILAPKLASPRMRFHFAANKVSLDLETDSPNFPNTDKITDDR